MDMTVECDGEGNTAQLEEWLATYGGAAASDACGDVTWSNSCTTQGAQTFTFACSFDEGEPIVVEYGAPIGFDENGYAIFATISNIFTCSYNADLERWEVNDGNTTPVFISNTTDTFPSCNTEDWITNPDLDDPQGFLFSKLC